MTAEPGRIWDQCCLYICCRFSSALETRLAGIRTGSSSQLEPDVAAGACGAGSGAVLMIFLALFAAGTYTSVLVVVVRFRPAVVVGC